MLPVTTSAVRLFTTAHDTQPMPTRSDMARKHAVWLRFGNGPQPAQLVANRKP